MVNKALLISLAVSLYTRKIIFSLVLLGWADENSFIRPSFFLIPFSINYPKMNWKVKLLARARHFPNIDAIALESTLL